MNKAIILILDNVLITTISGKPFPLYSEDWKFTNEWYTVLSKSIEEGYKLCIVDNQFDAGSTGYVPDNIFNKKIEKICTILEKDLSLPINSIATNFALDEVNTFRCIPNPGLLYELASDYDILLYDSILIGNKEEHSELAKYSGIGTYLDITDINF